MTVLESVGPRRADAREVWATAAPWAQALAVFVASRVFFTFAIDRHAWLAGPRRDGSRYSYLDISGNWDGVWYHRVAVEGYPGVLPRGVDGLVEPNQWAFYPLYPLCVRALVAVTGAVWPLAAGLFSLACAAAAVVVMRALVASVAGRSLALWTVALFCFFPSAAVLQLPYSEALAVLLLVAVLALLQRHSTGGYLAAIPLVLMLGLARPIAPALAAVIGLHLVRRWRWARRGEGALGRRELAALLSLTAAAGIATVAWSATAALVTGERLAYVETMASWRASRQVVPFQPWWEAARHYLGPGVGALVLVVTLVALVWWLTRPSAAVIAGDQRAWCVCYFGYLLAVLDSFTSLPRYLLPLFPLGTLAAAASPSRAYRVMLVVTCALGGLVWLAAIWRSPDLAP
jgi:hypothetical protein